MLNELSEALSFVAVYSGNTCIADLLKLIQMWLKHAPSLEKCKEACACMGTEETRFHS